MILLRRKDFPVPALPVKNTFLPLLTTSSTLSCSRVSTTGASIGLDSDLAGTRAPISLLASLLPYQHDQHECHHGHY